MTKTDIEEQSNALVDAMLRACKREGYRAVVRQIRLFEQQLAGCFDEGGKASLRATLDKLKTLRESMTPPQGYAGAKEN